MDSTTHTGRPNAAANASPKRATGTQAIPRTRGPNDARARLRRIVLAAALACRSPGARRRMARRRSRRRRGGLRSELRGRLP